MENRDKLAEYFKELGFTKGVEVGVERGYFSEILCKANPDLKLFCVDAWQVYDGYRDHTRQEKLERYYNETIERLKL